MKFVPINTAVVVVAKAHSPSMLQPAFLHGQNIVPADWQIVGNVLSTPVASLVRYANGVSFVAEGSKLVIRDDSPTQTNNVQELAMKYVEAAPHAHYTAVGINFDGYVECANPEEWVKDRFLKRGAGNDDKLKPHAVGFKFSYLLENGVLTLSCDAGAVQRLDDKRETPSILISANYHLPVSETSLYDVRNAIGSYSNRLSHFTELTDSILGLESEKP